GAVGDLVARMQPHGRLDRVAQRRRDLALDLAPRREDALLREERRLVLDPEVREVHGGEERARLLAFGHGEYYALGERVGVFGFSAVNRRRGAPKTASKKGKNDGKRR
ncbi:MAG: hypothetical protein J6P88_03440, partial [Clostridia bacterium]|nr:hypothetical protein [Clostridia bacterium]